MNYCVLPEAWKTEVCKGLNPQSVARTLQQRGFLDPGRDQLAKVERIGKKSYRCYAVREAILELPAAPVRAASALDFS